MVVSKVNLCMAALKPSGKKHTAGKIRRKKKGVKIGIKLRVQGQVFVERFVFIQVMA